MLQGGEIIIILLVALLVLGPRRLPEMARKIGGWTAELRSAAREVRQGLEAEIGDLKDIGDDLKGLGGEIKAPLDEFKAVGEDIKRDVESVGEGPQEWTGPKPVSGPTPEDAMADLEEIEKQAAEDDGA
ncbi:MAG: twin-arginine translocase TatA/TatE family subunit [Acidimicrobiia bacterium]